MSELPKLEIVIVMTFDPCESGELYQLGGECYTLINGTEKIVGKYGPLRDFMPTPDVKGMPRNNITICLKGPRHHMVCCDVSNGLRAFNAIIRKTRKGQ